MYSFSCTPAKSHTEADVVVSFSLKPGRTTLKSFAADTEMRSRDTKGAQTSLTEVPDTARVLAFSARQMRLNPPVLSTHRQSQTNRSRRFF
jgi:hypothetical protein